MKWAVLKVKVEVRNDSAKKQTPAPVDPIAQQPPISSRSTLTSSKKACAKSSASTPSKSPGISSISRTLAIHATVLQAGSQNLSRTLVPYPAWDARPLGRSLSRHTLSGSVASAPAVAAASGRGDPTVWGRG